MKKIFLLVIVLILYTDSVESKNDTRIMLIGSSSAQGMDPHFRKILKKKNISYLGNGIHSTFINDWVKSEWLHVNLRNFRPTFVIVSVGINDSYTNKSEENIENAITELNAIIERSGASPMWVGPPTLPNEYNGHALNPRLVEVIRNTPNNVFRSELMQIERKKDKLHVTSEGSKKWSNSIIDWVIF